ncbi:MAG: hypothetical protein JSV08_08520 [Acidobacteriota bacterium]|nr:MAG: hypothetical protein JSV08_08520 [Acidobacteriota bacterium]
MRNAVKLGLVLVCALLVVFTVAAEKEKKGKKKKAKAVDWSESTKIVWPPPPAEPVIRFFGSYWGDFNFPESRKGRLWKKLVGEKQDDRYIYRPFDVAVDSKRQRIYASAYAYIGVFDIVNKNYSQFTGKAPYLLRYVTGLDVDDAGNFYAVDAKSKVVVAFDPWQSPIRTYGDAETFVHPVDVGVNESLGRVYVSDSKANAVHVFSKEEGKLLFSFGSLGSEDGQFYKPGHIWVDEEGLVYVTDFFNFRVQGFDADGEFLFKVGSLGTSPGNLAKPKGVAVDSEGHIYVADSAFGNVQIFNREGEILLVFGEHGWEDGHLNLPSGIFIDDNDRIYVADSVNCRISVFEFLGTPEETPGASEAKAP